MESSIIAGWTDFLVAAAGATGALAGLVFVAVSINLERILKLPGVTGRAGETLILLAGALVNTLVALIPGESSAQLGLLLLIVGLLSWGAPTVIQIQTFRKHQFYSVKSAVVRCMSSQIATLPAPLAGLSLLGYLPGGLSWLGAFVVLCLVVGLLNAWILLVEILR
jgi:hypothetical protein